jgi:tetratricopeptide (TPR) repeat protein
MPEAIRLEPAPLAPGGISPDPPAIRISRRTATPKDDNLLGTANEAFHRGEAGKAREGYRKLLQTEPNHRGALLGLAGLAVQEGAAAEARDLYLRLLAIDPADALAKAGLLSVVTGNDPARLESELKLLLAIHPDLAPLFFLLGNLHAENRRWNEAQQAYFQAVQAMPKAGPPIPDYLFNLAVSLEHLGQRAIALRYYHQALDLTEGHRAGFDRAALLQRILDLEALEEKR